MSRLTRLWLWCSGHECDISYREQCGNFGYYTYKAELDYNDNPNESINLGGI